MEKLREILTQALPGLAENVIDGVMLKLEEMGVDAMDDMNLVKERDLVPPLKLLQARRFVMKCKDQGTAGN